MQVISDEKLYKSIWDKIYQEYLFSTQNEKWLYPDIEYDVYRLETVWDEKQEAIVNKIFCRIVGEEMYALDWQHDCFIFNPKENIPFGYQYYDLERDYSVYFPTYYPDGGLSFLYLEKLDNWFVWSSVEKRTNRYMYCTDAGNR